MLNVFNFIAHNNHETGTILPLPYILHPVGPLIRALEFTA